MILRGNLQIASETSTEKQKDLWGFSDKTIGFPSCTSSGGQLGPGGLSHPPILRRTMVFCSKTMGKVMSPY